MENDVQLQPEGFFTGYDPNTDATILNSMVTAAMRMGHSLVRNYFTRRTRNRRVLPSIPTTEFYNPVFLYDASFNGVDGILQGLVSDRARRIDGNFARAVSENLRPEPDQRAADLPAINIQRARDHGLPSYNVFRALSGQNLADSIEGFENIPSTIRTRLARLYNDDPNEVDLYAGAMHETPTDPRGFSRLGPTFTHILLEGFKRLRIGDRFWYERGEERTGFTEQQLAEIRKISLARIICDNTDDIERIQSRVFFVRRLEVNDLVECSSLPFINLRLWRATVTQEF